MNNLLVDIGNTSVKIAVAQRGRLRLVQRCDALTAEVLQPLVNACKPAMAMVVSVRRNDGAVTALLESCVKKVVAVTYKTPMPVRNLYASPETLGIDRLAAAVGAHYLFPQRDCMIIDCGTAITIDFLGGAGEFMGGNISPGLQTRFKALHDYTGRLPLGAITDHVAAIGTTTQEAIEAGVLQGAVNELEGYMARYPTSTTIFTGGDAIYFAKKIKNPIFAVCNLNFIGLAKIADYNAYI